jgi:hypothetical protein
MRTLGVFIKREWMEWRRLVLGAMLVAIFLFSLGLLQINRGIAHLNEKFGDRKSIDLDGFNFNDFNMDGVEIHIDDENYSIEFKNEGEIDGLERGIEGLAIAYGIMLLIGFSLFFGLSMFIGMFYFSDSIYKERSDNSTLFYRSLPVNDHVIILSKILSGALGVLIVSLGLGFIYFVFTQLTIFMIGAPLSSLAQDVLNRFAHLDFFVDLATIELLMLVWLLPVALFFMLISSVVKSRPLFIATGAPILFMIAWQIIVGDTTLIKPIFKVASEIAQVIQGEWTAKPGMFGFSNDVELLGDFTKYLFSLRSAISLLVSGAFYYGIVSFYRKNIPTS